MPSRPDTLSAKVDRWTFLHSYGSWSSRCFSEGALGRLRYALISAALSLSMGLCGCLMPQTAYATQAQTYDENSSAFLSSETPASPASSGDAGVSSLSSEVDGDESTQDGESATPDGQSATADSADGGDVDPGQSATTGEVADADVQADLRSFDYEARYVIAYAGIGICCGALLGDVFTRSWGHWGSGGGVSRYD